MKSTKSATIQLTETLSVATVIGEDNIHYIMSIDANAILGISARQDHVARSLKALLGNDLTLAKITQPGTRSNVTAMTLKQFDLLLAETAFKGNLVAQEIVRGLSGTALQLLSDHAHGLEITGEKVKALYEERTIHRDSYLDTFCIWTKLDGGDNLEYVKRLSSLKKKAGLPGNLSVHQMNKEQLKRINTAESFYNGLRKSGKRHIEVMAMLPFMF
jgi:hypothetical protein